MPVHNSVAPDDRLRHDHRPPRLHDALACVTIAGAFTIASLLVGPHPQTPVIDDWLYAASVQELLTTGHLRLGAISAVYPIFQILWGALFCALFGFSFAVLRASTLVLAALGCIALYAMLRELGRRPAVSLLASLTLGASPTFFLLSSSFMTDVPFLALVMLALYAWVSALQRGSQLRWWLGAGLSIGAFLVRPLGIALPVAAALGAWRARRLTPGWLAPALVSLAGMAALQLALPMLFGALDMGNTRTVNIRYVLMVTPGEYARWTAHLLCEAAFPMAPLVVAALCSRPVALRIALASALVAATLWLLSGGLPFPLPDNQTWSLRDMAARTLIACTDIGRAPWTEWMAPLLPAAGTVVLGAMVAGATAVRAQPECARGTGTILLAFAGLELLIANALWLYNDRYYIVFAPALAYLVTALAPMRVRVAVPLVALWAVVSVTGVRDTLAFNETVSAAVQTLEDSGVAASDIDAGWVSNGWRLYVHPEKLPVGSDRAWDVPFVTNTTPSLYLIANCPQPGYQLVKTIPLPAATWQGTDRLLVLRKVSATQ